MQPCPTAPSPPAWVCKRDGRLVPFEADKISRALFAVTEQLGQPNAFLARELTDGIVHFLAAGADGNIPATTEIAELLVKVVRELGHPTLAVAFTQGQKDKGQHLPSLSADRQERGEIVVRFAAADPPAAIVRDCLRSYTLQAVFTRDLVAAQREGLLTLHGLEAPYELATLVLGPPPSNGRLIEAIETVRRCVGTGLAVDGPEFALAALGDGSGETAATRFVRELTIGLRATGLRGVVNLNCAVPPSWADDLAAGPLFAAQQRPPEPQRLHLLADAILERLLESPDSSPCSAVRIDWHLSERDFHADGEDRLARLVRLALDEVPVRFVFDRPRRSVALAEGANRHHPAVLLRVDLDLPTLAAQPGVAGRPEVFLQKLGSLARLALSAAVQKRDFLRRQGADRPELTRGFLLNRARLVVAPRGLEHLAATLLGEGLCSAGPALDFARQVIQRLRDVLHQDGQASRLPTALDGDPLASLPGGVGERQTPAREAIGLTAWDGTAPVKQQLRVADVLHTAAEAGTAVVLLPWEPASGAEVSGWLRWAWRHTNVVRLVFRRQAVTHRQLTLRIDEEG